MSEQVVPVDGSPTEGSRAEDHTLEKGEEDVGALAKEDEAAGSDSIDDDTFDDGNSAGSYLGETHHEMPKGDGGNENTLGGSLTEIDGANADDKVFDFPKLSPELRAMIRNLTFSEPRNVKICDDIISSKLEDDPLPVALHVCRESRGEAMKKYTITQRWTSFAGRDRKPLCLGPRRDNLYFEFQQLEFCGATYEWILWLQKSMPSCIQNITSLTLFCRFTREFLNLDCMLQYEKYQEDLDFQDMEPELALATFLLFPQLSRLHIKVENPYSEKLPPRFLQVVQGDIKQRLEERGSAFRIWRHQR
ncbi:hypothetical protein G7Y89_g12150 [Cudoniella acicularis]|uniref:2EXR domain-containing protein n=1 Tax=Cudoniella acicularis TaxID=354080 RepID=A0A8H4VZG1_9HELO|nr:hypothetical protein G7Y89_g12150 [Cudoniella acicularis]